MAEERLELAEKSRATHTATVPRQEHPGRQRTFYDYLAILRRRKWIALIPVLLVPVVAYVAAARQPPVYAASSSVLLSRDNLGSALSGITDADVFANADRFAETQAQLARVPEVFARTVERSGTDVSASELFANSSVAPIGNADLLSFTVSSENGDDAVRLAAAYAEAFTQYRLELDTAALADARQDIEKTLREMRSAGLNGTPDYRELARKAQELQTMEILQTPAAVVKVPDNASQIAPTPRREALLGLAVGLLLGLAAALLWDGLDKRVRDEEEIQRGLGLPLLGRLPAPREHKGRPRLTMLDDPSDTEAEAVRRLRSNLEFANLDVNAKSIMVTSSVGDEGKSVTITNLAIALARSGRRVALVDLDLRKPSIGTLLGVGYRPGITDVAIGRIELSKALVSIQIESPTPQHLAIGGRGRPAIQGESGLDDAAAPGELWMLPAGFVPASPGELVGTQAVARILEQLEQTVDYVLVDAPPFLVVSDAMTLSNRVDATLVVVRLGIVNRPMLRELARQLEASPARKLGFVLAGADAVELYGMGEYGYGRPEPESRRQAAREAEPALGFSGGSAAEYEQVRPQRRG